jgi:hypothetical protein
MFTKPVGFRPDALPKGVRLYSGPIKVDED